MIIPVLKEVAESIRITTSKNEVIPIPFGHGRKPAANLMNDGSFIWVYPIMESDQMSGSNSIGTSYDCIIGFCIPGEVEPGTDVEQSYIDQAREYCFKFEQKLARHDFVKSLSNIKREPFYNFLAENLYGFNIRLTINSRYPYSKC